MLGEDYYKFRNLVQHGFLSTVICAIAMELEVDTNEPPELEKHQIFLWRADCGGITTAEPLPQSLASSYLLGVSVPFYTPKIFWISLDFFGALWT